MEFKTTYETLCVFFDKDGKILFTYPGVKLDVGDKVVFKLTEYMVIEKSFIVETGAYHYHLAETEGKDSS